MGKHNRLWKLTPFGVVREESYINESDCQALPGPLSANMIQRGHLDLKFMLVVVVVMVGAGRGGVGQSGAG